MKIRLIILFLLLPLTYSLGQTVVKIPFKQAASFSVQPQSVYKSLETSIDLGLEIEILGGSGSYSFSWVHDGLVIATTPTTTISKTGTYYLTIADGEGCESTVTYSISDGASIEDQFEEKEFTIYPNPAKEIIFIKKPEFSKISKVEILTVDGKIIKTVSPDFSIDNILDINIESLSAGYYLVVSYFENIKITKVLIVN